MYNQVVQNPQAPKIYKIRPQSNAIVYMFKLNKIVGLIPCWDYNDLLIYLVNLKMDLTSISHVSLKLDKNLTY